MRLRHLHRNHRRQPLAQIIAHGRCAAFDHVGIPGVRVHRAGQGRPEAGQVRSPVNIANVVRKGQYIFCITVVVLHRHFARQAGFRILF